MYCHWLDRSKEVFDEKLIEDAKSLLRVLVLYLPLPLFWALFDQQGSRWTFQAARMHGKIYGVDIQADQTQVANPLLALMLIPLFERVIYPRFSKQLVNPLSKMIIGGLVAGAAFLASGLLEIQLEETYPDHLWPGKSGVNIINTLPCEAEVIGLGPVRYLLSADKMLVKDIPADPWAVYEVLAFAPFRCKQIDLESPRLQTFINFTEEEIPTLLLGVNSNNSVVVYLTGPQDLIKSLTGKPKIRVILLLSSLGLQNVSIIMENIHGLVDEYLICANINGLAISAYMELPPGNYNYSTRFQTFSGDSSNITDLNIATNKHEITLEMGAVYSLVIRERHTLVDFERLYTLTPPSNIHMMWLLPQYLLISIAEVMFAVSGLEFSFTQAPKSMKTITIAAWYLSVASGNLIVICITQAKLFRSQAHEFFLFAVLICMDMALFWYMAKDYCLINVEADGSSCALLPRKKIIPHT